MDDHSPARIMAEHAGKVRRLSDDELLSLLESMPPLPDGDDDDPAWDDDGTWDRAYLFMVLAEAIGERRLLSGIAPLFERAPLGDAYELLRALPSAVERAVAPDLLRLVPILRPLLRHPRAGCRRWAVSQLGNIRDPSAFGDLLGAIDDREPLVREEAVFGLSVLGEALGADQRGVARAKVAELREDESEDVREWASDALEHL